MQSLKFRMVTDEEGRISEGGMLFNIHENWSMYLPTQPSGLGHDLLDHANNERGLLWQEIAALGSMTWRYEFGYNSDKPFYRPWAEIKASDLISSWRDNTELQPAPRVQLDDEALEQIDALLNDMRPLAREMFEIEFNDYSYDETIKENPIDDDAVWEMVCGWFRFGFYRSAKRFDEPYEVQHMAKLLETEVTKVWEALEMHTDDFREFTLTYDVDTGSVEVRGLPEDDEFLDEDGEWE